MYQTGDRVIYGSNGICTVESVGVPDFETFEQGKLYYFLRLESDGSRIYAPVDTTLPIRLLTGRQEALALLQSLPQLPVYLPASRDRKAVTAHYQQLMRAHTLQALACTVKSIYAQGKGMPGRLPALEEGLLKKAENQLYSELAAALELSLEEVRKQLLAAIRGK